MRSSSPDRRRDRRRRPAIAPCRSPRLAPLELRQGAVDTRTVNPPPDSDDARLMEPEAQLDAIFSQSGVGMTIVDRDLRIVRANRGLRGLRRSDAGRARRADDRRGPAAARAADRPGDAGGARDGRARDRPGARARAIPGIRRTRSTSARSAARSSRPTARSSASCRPSSRSPTCGTCSSSATTRSRDSARATPPSCQPTRQARLARYRTIFEGASIGIIRVDRTGRVVEVNPALERMLGYSAAELAAMQFQEYTHADDVEENLR